MFNRLIFWLALGFLIYVLATSRFGGDETQRPATKTETNQTQMDRPAQNSPKKPSLFESTVDNIIRPVMEGKLPPELSQNLKNFIITKPKNIEDITAGEGNIVICGSKVNVRYTLDGIASKSDIEFEVGKRTVFPGLERVVKGMKEKGVRKADLPLALAYNNMALAKDIKTATKTVPIRVELLSSAPDVSYEPHMIQIFDKKFGTEDPAQCLDTIRVHYSVRTLEGKQLADTESTNKPLTLTLGKGRLPLGIEQVLIGMQEGGERTAILFPEVMNRASKINQIMLLNESSYPDSTLIFEFKRLKKP